MYFGVRFVGTASQLSFLGFEHFLHQSIVRKRKSDSCTAKGFGTDLVEVFSEHELFIVLNADSVLANWSKLFCPGLNVL